MTAATLLALDHIGTANENDWDELIWKWHIAPLHICRHLLHLLR